MSYTTSAPQPPQPTTTTTNHQQQRQHQQHQQHQQHHTTPHKSTPSIPSCTKRTLGVSACSMTGTSATTFFAPTTTTSRFKLKDKCRSEKWEVFLYRDMTIKVDRGRVEVLPRDVPPPWFFTQLGNGSHTIFELCLLSERGMGMSMPLTVPVSSGKFIGTCVSTGSSFGTCRVVLLLMVLFLA